MKLTKYAHSCVRFDDGASALVIDPGAFSEAATALAGAQAVLITHEHADHVDVAAVSAALTANPELRVWAPAGVAAMFADQPQWTERITVVGPGEEFTAAGFAITTHGGHHALIHPTVPGIANVGYLINGSVFHPGDSLIVPTVAVETLLLPLQAPWSKVSEVVDFAVAVRAPVIHAIHDVLVTDTGRGVSAGHVERIAGWHGSEYRYLAPGESRTI